MTAYDKIIYPSATFPQTHPDRMATNASILGMSPAPPAGCRVLEIGCSDGGNLVPLAFNFPASEFVGIDLAALPLESGRGLARELGLKNLRLLHMGVEDVPSDFGRFDYIIAHGVYSWVPAAARDRILAICREHLAPQGVGYVSYNALPGGHLRRMTREMMLWHVRDLGGADERVGAARGLVELLSAGAGESQAFSLMLKEEAERVKRYRPEQLFHDDLADVNDPVYFHEFVEHAARHGLQYLSEADFPDMSHHLLPQQTVEALRSLADDPLLVEQYADFIKCRRFRQTLVCHSEVALARGHNPHAAERLHVAGPVRAEGGEPDVGSPAAVTFKSFTVETSLGYHPGGVISEVPFIKAALALIGERWPQSVGFDELVAEARARAAWAGAPDEGVPDERHRLGKILIDLYAAGFVKLHSHRHDFMTRAGERPHASALARSQARRGLPVVGQRFNTIEIRDPMGRNLLQLLDGTRDRTALVEELARRIRSGLIDPASVGLGVTAEQLIESLPEGLEKSLEGVAGNSLLVA
jgi:methyltransferase-like protein